MQSISLTVNPTSGLAPLTVNYSATVTSDSPFQGYVVVNKIDMTGMPGHRHPTYTDFAEVFINGAPVTVSFPSFTNGVAGHTYQFLGFLETSTGQIVAQSDPIFVTVS